MILADLSIDGKPRHVLMQANKNGFFYVLDRKSGALISAKAIVPVTWASGVDLKTGRPIENKEARYSETGKPVDVKPGPLGAHNWQPMAFNAKTGLVYIPAQQVPMHYTPLPILPIAPIGWNLGVAPSALTSQNEGFLLAWDPVRQREAWRVAYKGPWNGGVVTTAGNIVAQGDAAGNFNVYRADNGEKLWSMFAQSGIIAAPSTFEVAGEQYIAVLSGWGGSYALSGGKAAAMSGNLRNVSRLLGVQTRRHRRIAAARAARHRHQSAARAGGYAALHCARRAAVRSILQRLSRRACDRRRCGAGSARFEFPEHGFFLQHRPRWRAEGCGHGILQERIEP